MPNPAFMNIKKIVITIKRLYGVWHFEIIYLENTKMCSLNFPERQIISLGDLIVRQANKRDAQTWHTHLHIYNIYTVQVAHEVSVKGQVDLLLTDVKREPLRIQRVLEASQKVPTHVYIYILCRLPTRSRWRGRSSCSWLTSRGRPCRPSASSRPTKRYLQFLLS